MMLTAQKMRPYFGVALIDGYEGMKGNGPISAKIRLAFSRLLPYNAKYD